MLLPRLGGIVPKLNLPVPVSIFIIYVVCLTPILLLLYIELSKRAADARNPKGCRKLGLHNFSNLNDEDDYDTSGRRKRRQPSKNSTDMEKIRIKALLAYPIKSCAAVEFNIADVVSTGMAYDRQFCFAEYFEATPAAVTEAEKCSTAPPATGQWVARTLRDGKYSKMTLIRPEIWIPDPSSPTYSPKRPEVRSKGVLVINYPRIPTGSSLTRLLTSLGMKFHLCAREESFHVPLHPPPKHTYPSAPMRIWKDSPMAFDYGKHLPPSLLTFLGSSKPVTLFRVDPDHHRSVLRCAPRKDALGFQPITGFADAYPLHLLGLSSVRDIAERTRYAIPSLSVKRFRPNVVLEGSEAFAEDSWKRIRILPRDGQAQKDAEKEGVEVYTACRTVRCRLPNVDPNTGVRHAVEPDKTLKSFRCIDPGDVNNACLGMQCVPAVQEFTLRVGDEIQVLESGEHFYIKQ
ncbi:hypothetical protein FQN52_002201 [Onygenales sp. PD_12]|nr:hypothetical protein FQN52_002201 [Onygenales sp. PD_12]